MSGKYTDLGICVFDAVSAKETLRRLTLTLIGSNTSMATMESCTGGALASYITDTEGASTVFKGAIVAYTNLSKELTGIPSETIERFGVYSPETALKMAIRCREAFKAEVGAGVTGSFSNPDPANADSVPGEVYFALSNGAGDECFKCQLPLLNDRAEYKLCVSGCIAGQLLRRLGAEDRV